MEQNRTLIAVIRIAVFTLVVIILGVLSIANLVRFYVNDEVDYNEWTPELGNKFETDVASCFYKKFSFVNLNGAIGKLLDQPEVNGITKLNNGWLQTNYEYIDDEQLQKNADAVIRLKNYLNENGKEFLYLITPYTSCKYDPQLPTGVEDYGNDDLDRFAEMLREGGVEVIDIRETMHDDGINQYDMMFKTDHHWTPRAGFYAFGKINNWLKSALHCNVDSKVEKLNNYTITKYEDWHLGTRGQRTGAYYAGMDDFDLIVPDFDTALERNGEEGTYESLIIDRTPLQSKNQMLRWTYDDVYKKVQSHYKNYYSWNDKKLLVYTDSFGNVVLPFLSIAYYEIDYRFGGIDNNDIETYDPDAVVMFFYAGNALSSGLYNFVLPE